jgi:hypothetical protein
VDSLTYVLVPTPAPDDGFQLTPASPQDVTDGMWDELAAQIATEPGMLPVSAWVLARRYDEGYAELVLHEGRIIHYSSLAPVALPGEGPHSWLAIAAGLDLDPSLLPSTAVYELGSGWTDRQWRGKGINQVQRQQLVDRHLRGDALGLSGMAGVAAPLDRGLGWELLAWDTLPYVTSLVGVTAADFPEAAEAGWRPRAGLRPYRGPGSPRNDPTQRWEDLAVAWGSDAALASRLDQQLAASFTGDLRRWRSAVVATFEQPQSLHRLPFFS